MITKKRRIYKIRWNGIGLYVNKSINTRNKPILHSWINFTSTVSSGKKRKGPADRGSPTPRKKIAFDLNDANDPDFVDFVIREVDDEEDDDDDMVITKEVAVDSTVVTAEGGDHEGSETQLLKSRIAALGSFLREKRGKKN